MYTEFFIAGGQQDYRVINGLDYWASSSPASASREEWRRERSGASLGGGGPPPPPASFTTSPLSQKREIRKRGEVTPPPLVLEFEKMRSEKGEEKGKAGGGARALTVASAGSSYGALMRVVTT